MRFIYIDTETALTRRSLMAPPLACLTWAERHGAELKNGIMGAHDATRWAHQVLDDDGVYLGGHFVQFDMVVLAQADNTLLPKIFRAYRRGRILCTDLRQRLLDLGRDSYILKRNQQRSGSYTLDTLVKKYFGHQLDKSTWRLRYGQLIDVPVRDWPEGAIRYALDDVGWGLLLYEKQGELAIKHGFQGQRPMSVLDDDAQARSGFALQLMRAWGMRTDVNQVAATKERYERSYKMARQQLMSTKVNGKTILRPDGSQDMKFTKQLITQAWLNGGRKLADILLTEKGEDMRAEGRLTPENIVDVVQTGKDMLDIVGDDPVLAPLKGFKNIQKTLKTFIPVVERGAYEPICPYFNTLVTNGRSSCSDPNLQNLPRGGGVRECFIPRKGKIFVNADYDSLEARTFAEVLYIMGFGTTLLNSYLQNPDFDPHARLGSQILNISEAEGLLRKSSSDDAVKKAFKEVRQRSKVANFGYPGGMGAATFIDYAKGYGLRVSLDEAKELKSHWLKSVPEAKRYFRWVSQQTGAGKARVQQLLSGRWRGGLGYTDLANTMWSGLAADGVKEATFDVQEACYAIPTSPLYGTRCVAVIHDELIAECEPEGGHEIGHELSRLMVEAMQRYTRHTPSRASPQLMYRWYKDAEPAYDKHGRLVPWEPSA